MTTKKEGYVFNKLLSLENHRSYNDNSNQFSNLNLSQGHKCPSLVQSFSKSNNDKFSGGTVNYKEERKTWNKSTNDSSLIKSKSSKLSNEAEKETKNQITWKNGKEPKKLNSSTLSLHIAAYENYVESLSKDDDTKSLQPKPKALKFVDPLLNLHNGQDSLEFPRQMEDDKSSATPEIQQFAASQRLFSPNQGSSSSSRTPSPGRSQSSQMQLNAGVFPFGDDYKQPMSAGPRAVHQCNICNKIFVSFKGLQQHAIIHTDQKPFTCEICNKSFRFKSNLFEHRSVHSGFTPHACPYCGKTCRLKGNLKKHLKTHVTTKEELDEAWKPFASNRRPPAEVPHDAIIVRSTGEPMFTPPSRPRKRKLGLGSDARSWIDKIHRGDILPTGTLEEKLTRFRDMLKMLEANNSQLKTMLNHARTIAFEKFECPMCKAIFQSRGECSEHLDLEHPLARVERPMFCEICLKSFIDRKSMEQHESYHKRVHLLVESGELELNDPEILVPTIDDEPGDTSFGEQQPNEQVQDQIPQLQNHDDSIPVSTHDPAQSDNGQLF